MFSETQIAEIDIRNKKNKHFFLKFHLKKIALGFDLSSFRYQGTSPIH